MELDEIFISYLFFGLSIIMGVAAARTRVYGFRAVHGVLIRVGLVSLAPLFFWILYRSQEEFDPLLLSLMLLALGISAFIATIIVQGLMQLVATVKDAEDIEKGEYPFELNPEGFLSPGSIRDTRV